MSVLESLGAISTPGAANRRNFHHGHTKREGRKVWYSPTYSSWHCMRGRCRCPGNASYPEYGGRGIVVCDRWNVFVNFLEDMGPRPEGMTLDRRDPNGNYEPSNCRWATPTEQNRNKRPRQCEK